jgi:GTP-sensing pleiotropic transcriptional regulator CodY
MTSTCTNKLRDAEDQARHLRERVAELESDREARLDREERERRQRRKESTEAYESSLREASDFGDAINKQLLLTKRELHFSEDALVDIRATVTSAELIEETVRDIESQKRDIAKLEHAAQVYREETRIAEEQIKAIRADALKRVLSRTEDAFGLHDAMRENDPSGWLQW